MTTTVNRRNPKTGVVATFLQFLTLRAQATDIATRQNSLKNDLLTFVEANGVEDEKGHRLHTLPAPVEVAGTTFAGFQRQRKVTESFNEEAAETILHSKGLLAEAQTTVTFIDQDKVMRLYGEDKITEDELDSMITKKISYSFVPVKA